VPMSAHRELRPRYARISGEPHASLPLVTENHPDIVEHSQDDSSSAPATRRHERPPRGTESDAALMPESGHAFAPRRLRCASAGSQPPRLRTGRSQTLVSERVC
jgi:hypothetical protein